MDRLYIDEQNFDKIDYEISLLKKGEYEKCTFTNCNFSNSDISDTIFIDCKFTLCNLSMVKTTGTTFNNAKFNDCKMMGIRFDNCNSFAFSVAFDNCILNHSSFFRKKLKKTIFENSQLVEVDFTESDLTGSEFLNCELERAVFKSTIIEKADFRTSYNFSIDPEINRIKKAKFSLMGLAGLLDKYDLDIEGK